jgi:hypothetical protein
MCTGSVTAPSLRNIVVVLRRIGQSACMSRQAVSQSVRQSVSQSVSRTVSCAWRTQIATHHDTRNNTPIQNILSTAPQLSISQKALGTLPEDGNVMPKHVGATIHN